jgi:putative membrane protein
MDTNTRKPNKVAITLFILYWVVFAILAINPYARDVWWVENLTIMLVVLILSGLYWKGIRFSSLSYILMSVLIFVHTVGGHYTFARVPFQWVTDLFGFERNNYDRIGHFSVGFYAYAVAEVMEMYGLIKKRWVTIYFGLFAIMALAAGYEVFEWWYAISSDPTAGIAVLGSQGDIWDAQKDILADTLGALVALAVYLAVKCKTKTKDYQTIN